MREVIGNIWEVEGDWLIIPTNGSVKKDGTAVMGRGLALQAKQRFPGIEKSLGKGLSNAGNVLHVIRKTEKEPVLLSFPVKYDWKDEADLDLIRESARELRRYWLGTVIGTGNRPAKVLLPRVGCGNGRRKWGEVKPILEEELPDDSFVVVSLI